MIVIPAANTSDSGDPLKREVKRKLRKEGYKLVREV